MILALWIVAIAIIYFGTGVTLAYWVGRLGGKDDTDTAMFVFSSLFWPLATPICAAILFGKRGQTRHKQIRDRRFELEQEIRKAMPEVEALLKESLAPEIGTFRENMKELTRGHRW